MRQFMSNEEKRAWREAARTQRDTTPSEWVLAEVVRNRHLDATFVEGAIVYARREQDGWLVVRVTPSVVRPTDPTYGVVVLSTEAKAKWSLKSITRNGEVWHLDKTDAVAAERVVKAWREGKLADM
jgi:hypothetical protein